MQQISYGSEFILLSVEDGRYSFYYVRGAACGEKQLNRGAIIPPTELTLQLKADERSHAMSGEREWTPWLSGDGISHLFDERLQPFVRRLADALYAAWQMHQTYVYRGIRARFRQRTGNRKDSAGARG